MSPYYPGRTRKSKALNDLAQRRLRERVAVFVAALKLVVGNEAANGLCAGNGDRLVGKKAFDRVRQKVIIRGRPFLAEPRVLVVDGSPICGR